MGYYTKRVETALMVCNDCLSYVDHNWTKEHTEWHAKIDALIARSEVTDNREVTD